MKDIGLQQPGITDHGEGVAPEPVDRRQLQISQAATLSDLSDEYAWFTLGPMYKYVRLMGRDPWGDFIDESGRDESYQMTVRFDKPVLSGLEVAGDTDWNHVLWAMPRCDWGEYCQWMGRLSFVDRDLNLVTRLRTQEFRIIDPIFLDRVSVLPLVPPMVTVTAFALDTNQGCVFVAAPAPRREIGDVSPPPLVTGVPSVVVTGQTLPDTKAWATAILTGVGDPYQAAAIATQADPIAELAARVRAVREGKL